MKKLFRIIPFDHEGVAYGYYEAFLIAADSIPDALEVIYKHVSPEKQDIPYYLRSSNMRIEQIGTAELDTKFSHILMSCYYSGD